MRWNFTIKTSAGIYRTDIAHKNEDKVDMDLAKKLFNYLKSSVHNPARDKNIKPETANPKRNRLIPLYHGTNLAVIAKSEDYRMFLAPENTKAAQREPHASTNQILFTTRSRGYAASYVRDINGAPSCIVALRVPLYAIQEVRAAIFNPFVGHPYNYNESKHHIKLANLIQPELKNIRARLEELAKSQSNKKVLKEKEQELLSKLGDRIYDYMTTSAGRDEFTIKHGLPKRFIDSISIVGYTPLKVKDVQEIKEKYKTDAKFRQTFHECLKTNPFYWDILSEDELNQKLSNNPKDTVINLVKKSYQQWVSADNDCLSLLPERFQHDTEVLEYETADGKTIKTSMHSWINSNFTKPALQQLIAITKYDELSQWLDSTPLTIQNYLVVPLRQKILETMNPDPNDKTLIYRMASSLVSMKAFLFKDQQFISALNAQVFDKLSPSELQELMNWGESDNDSSSTGQPSDSDKFHPALANNLEIMKTYFRKVSPDKIAWDRYDPRIIKKLLPEIQECIYNFINSNDVFDVLGDTIPNQLLNETSQSLIIEKLSNNNDVGKFFESYTTMPDWLKNNPKIIETIQKYLLTGKVDWHNWTELDPSIYADPKFAQLKQEAQIMDAHIADINYNELNTDTLKEAYVQKAIKMIPLDPNIFTSLPEIVQLNHDVLAVMVKTIIRKANYYGMAHLKLIPEKIQNSPQFEPFKETIEESKIKCDFDSCNYANLKSEKLQLAYLERMLYLADDYVEKVSNILKDIPVDLNNPTIKAHVENIYKQLARGYGRKQIELESKDDNVNFSAVEIPDHILQNPFWDRNIFLRFLISYGRLRTFKSSQVPTDLKKDYTEALHTCITYHNNLSVLGQVDEPELVANIHSEIIDVVIHKKILGQSLHSSPLLDAIVEPHKKDINERILGSGYHSGLYPEVMTPEQKEKAKTNIINEILSSPPYWTTLEDGFKLDPDILNSVIRGIENKVAAKTRLIFPTGFIDTITKSGNAKLISDLQNLIINASTMYAGKFPADDDDGSGYYHTSSWRVLSNTPKELMNTEPLKSTIINKINNGLLYKCVSLDPVSFKETVMEMLPESPDPAFIVALDKCAKDMELKYYTDHVGEFQSLSEEKKKELGPQLYEYFKNQIAELSKNITGDSVYNLLMTINRSSGIMAKYPDWENVKTDVETNITNAFNNSTFPVQSQSFCHYFHYYADWSEKLPKLCEMTPERINKQSQYYISVNNLSQAARAIKDGLKTFAKHPLLKQTRNEILQKYIETISTLDLHSYKRKRICTECKRFFKTKKILELCDPNYKAPEPTPIAPAQPVANEPAQTEMPQTTTEQPKPLTTVKLPPNSGTMNKMVNKFKDYYNATEKEV